MSYTDRLDKIILRTQKLQKDLNIRQDALDKAREEAQQLKLQVDSQSHIIDELNNKIKIIKLARSFDDGDDIAALKRKINEYIREIDNSMALLND